MLIKWPDFKHIMHNVEIFKYKSKPFVHCSTKWGQHVIALRFLAHDAMEAQPMPSYSVCNFIFYVREFCQNE